MGWRFPKQGPGQGPILPTLPKSQSCWEHWGLLGSCSHFHGGHYVKPMRQQLFWLLDIKNLPLPYKLHYCLKARVFARHQHDLWLIFPLIFVHTTCLP